MNINPFIALYKTAKERLDEVATQHARVVLNPQMRLILEAGIAWSECIIFLTLSNN